MKECENKAQTLQDDNTGLANAKRRHWTDEEVAAAVEYLKREMPEEWAELERLELTTGDLNGSKAIAIQFGKLSKLYPECEPFEISQLSWKVRDVRRGALRVGK